MGGDPTRDDRAGPRGARRPAEGRLRPVAAGDRRRRPAAGKRLGQQAGAVRPVPERRQLQHLGHAIVGDKLYGLDESWYLKCVRDELTTEEWQKLILKNQALHAHTLRFHWRAHDWVFVAEPADEFVDFIETVSESEEETHFD